MSEEGHTLEPRDLPASIWPNGPRAGGMTFQVIIVDLRGEFKTVVAGCDSEDDAYEAVVPYVNTNYLKRIAIRPL